LCDEFVKTSKLLAAVIPAKAGIQWFQLIMGGQVNPVFWEYWFSRAHLVDHCLKNSIMPGNTTLLQPGVTPRWSTPLRGST
jgi:hypothetical protein